MMKKQTPGARVVGVKRFFGKFRLGEWGRVVSMLVVAGSMVVADGCARRRTVIITQPPPPAETVYIEAPPPPPQVESRPAQTSPGAVWIDGYWQWSGQRYVWVPGYWEMTPRGT